MKSKKGKKNKKHLKTDWIGCGPRIKEWRKGQGLKAFQLAEMLVLEHGHLSQGSLSDIENGKSYPSAPTILAFMLYTNINIYWMMTGKDGDIKKGESIELNIDRQVVHLTTTNNEILIKRM